MRPEDFHSRPTVNPTTKRIYAYGQMLFGALAGAAAIMAAIYAFLNDFATDTEVQIHIDQNNLDIVEQGNPLPHDKRFSALELETTTLRKNITELQTQVGRSETVNIDTLEILAGYLAADSERNPNYRFQRAAKAREDFRYYIRKGETPMEAFRLAMRPPGTPLR